MAQDLGEQAVRGEQAARLLSDPLMREAFDLVEQHILAKFKEAPVRDSEGIVLAKQLLHVFYLFRSVFDDAVRNGKLASDALDPVKRGAPFLGDWRKLKPTKTR